MYFNQLHTVDEVKAEYRRLAKQYHPDLGGTDELMKAINNAYHAALKGCHGQTRKGENNQEFRYTYDAEVEQGVMDKIHELLALKLEGVSIALMGTWVWITGDTRTVKDALKAKGCKYSGDKQCWYWHGGKYRRRHSKSVPLSSIARSYGYRTFSAQSAID
jgi:hypothetical protein